MIKEINKAIHLLIKQYELWKIETEIESIKEDMKSYTVNPGKTDR